MAGKIDIDTLRRLLRYEPETGKLFWLERSPDLFQDGYRDAAGCAANWNSQNAGNEAFTAYSKGYLHGRIFQRTYKAHRVAWALHYGEWPEDQIDHVNGDRADNRIENLRAVTNALNAQNIKLRVDNTTGVMGVYWFAARSKWYARITVDGCIKRLGYFDTFESAVSARKAAERKYGFHENHGREAA